MKLIVFIGPDTLALKVKSKKTLRTSLNRAMHKRTLGKNENQGHLGWRFKGRKYTYGELRDATILTLKEFFEANKVA